jgi:hypothetical protein
MIEMSMATDAIRKTNTKFDEKGGCAQEIIRNNPVGNWGFASWASGIEAFLAFAPAEIDNF